MRRSPICRTAISVPPAPSSQHPTMRGGETPNALPPVGPATRHGHVSPSHRFPEMPLVHGIPDGGFKSFAIPSKIHPPVLAVADPLPVAVRVRHHHGQSARHGLEETDGASVALRRAHVEIRFIEIVRQLVVADLPREETPVPPPHRKST